MLKMTNRRSKLEIYIDILEQIRSGTVIPTRIMYGANLSWKPLQQILKSLVHQDLITECAIDDDDKRTKKAYQLTEKGVNVLKYFNKAKELVEMDSLPKTQSWR
jgi:predicted transcriptional regulator